MKKFKKFIAIALSATMLFGSTVTAFAGDEGEENPVTSGGSTGEGVSEGHLDTHVVKVTLPTIPESSTPFKYTMDAERLIQDTEGGRYDNATFPEKDTDTGVYFLAGKDAESGKNVYANTSEALLVTSESSAAVKLKVEVEVESAATDITLVETAPAADADEAQLYLALKVGDKTEVIKKGAKASAEVEIAGIPGNFKKKVKADKSGYEYAPLTKGQEGFTDWNTTSISMTGAVSKASAKGLTAPKVKVTWSWTDPAAGTAPAISSITEFDKSAPEDVVIAFTLGSGTEVVDADGVVLYQGASNTAVNPAKYQVDMEAKTITIDKTATFLNTATADIPVKITLKKGEEEVKDITGKITIQ